MQPLKSKDVRTLAVRFVVLVGLTLALLVPAVAAGQESTATLTPSATPTPTPTPTPISDLKAFEIYPKGQILGDYFSPTIEAGKSLELVVVLANTGNVVFSGRTYATNAHSAVNGGFEVAPIGEVPVGVTLWLDYPEEVFSIEPGTGIERTFTISVPEGTEPGQYIASLVLEDEEALSVNESENFKQLVRFPVPVFITVPGAQNPGFSIDNATLTSDATISSLSVAIVNTGNIRVRPAGTITISDNSGAELFNIPVTMGSVYARDSTSLLIGLPTVLPPGDYIVNVELADPETTVSAEAELKVTSSVPGTPIPASLVQIFGSSVVPRPDIENVQFLDISLTIDNGGETITNGQVVLQVTRDGQLVERFVVASSLSFQAGSTSVQSRYIPVSGWVSGTWTFEVNVEVVDPTSGVSKVLSTTQLDDVKVP